MIPQHLRNGTKCEHSQITRITIQTFCIERNPFCQLYFAAHLTLISRIKNSLKKNAKKPQHEPSLTARSKISVSYGLNFFLIQEKKNNAKKNTVITQKQNHVDMHNVCF